MAKKLHVYSLLEGGGAKRFGYWQGDDVITLSLVAETSQHAFDLGALTGPGEPAQYRSGMHTNDTDNDPYVTLHHGLRPFRWGGKTYAYATRGTAGSGAGVVANVVVVLLEHVPNPANPTDENDLRYWKVVQFDVLGESGDLRCVDVYADEANNTLILYISRDKADIEAYTIHGTAPLPKPGNFSLDSATTDALTYTFDAVTGADGYEREVGGTTADNGSSTTVSLTGLGESVSRAVRVRAYSGAYGSSPTYGLWTTIITGTTLSANTLPATNLVHSVDPARGFIGDGSDLSTYAPAGPDVYVELIADTPAAQAGAYLWSEGYASEDTPATSPTDENSLLGLRIHTNEEIRVQLRGRTDADRVFLDTGVTATGKKRYRVQVAQAGAYTVSIWDADLYDANDETAGRLYNQSGTHPDPSWAKQAGGFGADVRFGTTSGHATITKLNGAVYSAIPDAGTKAAITEYLQTNFNASGGSVNTLTLTPIAGIPDSVFTSGVHTPLDEVLNFDVRKGSDYFGSPVDTWYACFSPDHQGDSYPRMATTGDLLNPDWVDRGPIAVTGLDKDRLASLETPRIGKDAGGNAVLYCQTQGVNSSVSQETIALGNPSADGMTWEYLGIALDSNDLPDLPNPSFRHTGIQSGLWTHGSHEYCFSMGQGGGSGIRCLWRRELTGPVTGWEFVQYVNWTVNDNTYSNEGRRLSQNHEYFAFSHDCHPFTVDGKVHFIGSDITSTSGADSNSQTTQMVIKPQTDGDFTSFNTLFYDVLDATEFPGSDGVNGYHRVVSIVPETDTTALVFVQADNRRVFMARMEVS